MTINSTSRKAGPFNGTGAQTGFPFTFKIFVPSDLRVVLTDAAGVESDQVLNAAYSVVINADQENIPGGSVTMLAAPPVGTKLTITSVVPITQGQSIPNNSGFYPKVVENAYDKLTIICQQLAEQVGRSVKFAISDTSTGNNFPPAAQRANNLLGFDASGNMVAVAPVAGTATALQSALGASTGSSLVGFIQSGVGAIIRTILDKLRERVSVKDFGAKGDGVTDDTAAIQAAVDATPAGIIFFPKGTYKVSSPINISSSGGVTLKGENQASVTILSTSTTANVINATGWFVRIESMYFLSNVVRTAGIMVNMTGAFCSIDNFQIQGDFIGIKMSGTSNRITNGVMGVGAGGGYRIWATGGDTSQVIDNCLLGSQAAPYPVAGIFVDSSAALTISNTSVIHQGIDLLIAPGNGQGVYSLFANNCFFDTASFGMQIATSGTGEVQRCRFANCWFSSMAADGISLVRAGSGNITGIHFVDPHIVGNASSGLSINSTGISDVTITGGEICGNLAHGITVAAGVSDFSIIGATIGSGAGFGANALWGIIIAAGASDRYIITNNRMYGNGSGALFDGGTGTNKSTGANLPLVGYATNLAGRGATSGAGTLAVVFSTPFAVVPSVVASAESNTAYSATPFNITVNGFSVNTYNAAGTQVPGIGVSWQATRIL